MALIKYFTTKYFIKWQGLQYAAIQQHYTVGVPQGSLLGPSVVLNIKWIYSVGENLDLISNFANASFQPPRMFRNNAKLNVSVLAKEMEPLSQPAKGSHPQDHSVTVSTHIFCLPLVQEIRNNNRKLSQHCRTRVNLQLRKCWSARPSFNDQTLNEQHRSVLLHHTATTWIRLFMGKPLIKKLAKWTSSYYKLIY